MTPLMMSVTHATESRRHGDRALISPRLRVSVGCLCTLFVVVASTMPVDAQRGRGGAAGPAVSPRQGAPIDLTGYWVSPIIEDWKDRKSTRLNSSHLVISYAVFCLKKKKNQEKHQVSVQST